MRLRLARFVGVAFCLGAFQVCYLRAQDNNAPAAPAPTDTGTPAPAPTTGPASAPTADTPTGAVSDTTATFQTFYDGLAGEGKWMQTQQYGYVWQPRVTDPNWAPYTDGYWAYSDQGWTWVSNEAWGWATYHYGRWANLENIGWVWVPGYVWAPAWVSWRTGDGNVGWAPLPPDSMVGTDYTASETTPVTTDNNEEAAAEEGYHIGDDSDYYYGIGPGWYIFVPIIYFCHHHWHDHCWNHYDNYSLIHKTHNVTNINVNHNSGVGRFHHVTMGGPSVAEINAASDKPVQQIALAAADKPGGGTLDGNTLSIFAPHIHTSSTASPTQVGMSVGEVKLNHGVDINKPLAVNNSLVPGTPTLEQIQKASAAQGNAAANAKVLTDAGMIKPIMQKPVTTLKPIATPIVPTNHAGSTFANGGAQPATGQVFSQQQRTFPQTGQPGTTTHIISGPVYPSGPSQQHVITPGTYNPYTRAPAAPSTISQSAGGSVPGESSRVYARPSGSPSSSPYSPYGYDNSSGTSTTPGGSTTTSGGGSGGGGFSGGPASSGGGGGHH